MGDMRYGPGGSPANYLGALSLRVAQSDDVGLEDDNLKTVVSVNDDGRINIDIDQKTSALAKILAPALKARNRAVSKLTTVSRRSSSASAATPPPSALAEQAPAPPLNVVIQIVGSRGDVQPFVALGKVLKETHGHRVRLATHAMFKPFVEENGLEFFNIGGNPNELMAYMVKNPGLLPSHDTFKHGEIGKRKKDIENILRGCWRSCIEAGDGMDDESNSPLTSKPFVADALIANPPSFAHIHCAEKLGIPLNLMFTMPWTPTQSFPHPLANIHTSNADPSMSNYLSYPLVQFLTWQGLGDVINKFRRKVLQLQAVSVFWAPILASQSKLPVTYCWSPALIPKPKDWNHKVDVVGFYFLNLASNYDPQAELASFLDAGPPPVYIGFGSIVVDDPNAMTTLIFEAVKAAGVRALVSKGWGGLGAEDMTVPEDIFLLGNVPHDWLFPRVSAVVHHGGAGTTAAGIAAGKPTIVVPFFGDQEFWGNMIARAGAGPEPIHHKRLTAKNLAEAILTALKPETLNAAVSLGERIKEEDGPKNGANSFHKFIKSERLRCSICPDRVAVWHLRRTRIKLSAFAAMTLSNEGLLDMRNLKPYRPIEYDLSEDPWDPVSGGVSAIVGTIANLTVGAADVPLTMKRVFDARTTKSPQRATSAGVVSRRSTLETVRSQTPPARIAPVLSSPGSSQISRRNSETSANGEQHHLKTCEDVGIVAHDVARGGAHSIAHEAHHLVSLPRELIYALAKGFHNAPRLYHDTTVRRHKKVVDFRSGINNAGKELVYGMYDGVTGVVTQPYQGAKRKGSIGLLKGLAKGVGGLLLKPEAAILGVPAFTLEGIHKELHKQSANTIEDRIVAVRVAEGFEDWIASTAEERNDVVKRWKELQSTIDLQANFSKEVRGRPSSRFLSPSRASKQELRRLNSRGSSASSTPLSVSPRRDQRKLSEGNTALDDDDTSTLKSGKEDKLTEPLPRGDDTNTSKPNKDNETTEPFPQMVLLPENGNISSTYSSNVT